MNRHSLARFQSRDISHDVRVPIHILADSREPREGVPKLLRELGVVVQTERLLAGDYEVADRALVERKTVRGLHAAVIAGTFWPQLGRLRDCARFAYLLIEGQSLDDGPVQPAAIRGICIAVMDLGVDMLRASDAMDSARWLKRLAVRRTEVRYRNAPAYAQRPKRSSRAPTAEAALGAVPGISRVRARALLSHFGTLAAVACATPEDWQKVRGIGPARARAIAETFHSVHD